MAVYASLLLYKSHKRKRSKEGALTVTDCSGGRICRPGRSLVRLGRLSQVRVLGVVRGKTGTLVSRHLLVDAGST